MSDRIGSRGSFVEAAVLGLTSCAGEGCWLIDAVCRASAIPSSGFDILNREDRPLQLLMKVLLEI